MTDNPSTIAELTDRNEGAPWALPIEPPTTDSNGESTSRHKILRRTPSAPELAQGRGRPTIGVTKHFVARSDSRLDEATADRWGITCVSDTTFRKVLTSYIVWDHAYWHMFDINEFCRAVSGKPSELASSLLVTAVFAYALKLYVHFDSEEANKYGVVRKRTERLWQESIDSQDDSIATAVAGAILLFLYGSESGKAYALLYHYVRVGLTLALLDTLGSNAFRRAQRILIAKGLYDPALVDQVYHHVDPAKSSLRSSIAWGILEFATMTELYIRPMHLLVTVPPVPMPVPPIVRDEWSPWPMRTPNLQAHTYEIQAARTRLGAIIREMLQLQRKCGNAPMDVEYLSEAQSLHVRYQEWLNTLEPCLRSCERASQQHILLHTTYHFSVFELFRPIVAGQSTASEDTQDNAPQSNAISASSAAVKALQQLLVRREALYGGLGINTVFCSPALAIIFDALPTASPNSLGYSPSSHMALLTGLRCLMHLSRAIQPTYYAVLGVQQAAKRMGLQVPMEAERMFAEVTQALKHSPWQEDGKKKKEIASDWVVDFSRAAANDDAARLGNLVKGMERLEMDDNV
ncbi:hypothetical protein KC340_g18296 [Hortaea werneckii]|nr:hypothetical protein KC342_g18506 [Hortaea werneckii]KAI7055130.1 hypothetical protein KC339_g18434 [Hortaea werneckii]KAI7203002.1 hypothetical protein KC365_g18350 [Hortaea werneckii]KAI7285720.1 hypothetical protein KC340_g18296 [Hortaea werneckii]KAI7370155.1 hypothetical protein KC328_g17808 [Hortaea werneckii]